MGGSSNGLEFEALARACGGASRVLGPMDSLYPGFGYSPGRGWRRRAGLVWGLREGKRDKIALKSNVFLFSLSPLLTQIVMYM